MEGYVFPVKFVTTALIWHSSVLWNISWEILFLLLRQPCIIRYEIHVISIHKWSLVITKSLLFRCENSGTVTNYLYQRLRSPCKFRYDIPIFSYITAFGVTKAVIFNASRDELQRSRKMNILQSFGGGIYLHAIQNPQKQWVHSGGEQ
jgi:hypothetical protein